MCAYQFPGAIPPTWNPCSTPLVSPDTACDRELAPPAGRQSLHAPWPSRTR